MRRDRGRFASYLAELSFGGRLLKLKIVAAPIAEHAGSLTLNEDSNGQIDDSGQLGRITVEARTIDSLTD